jgi:DNA-directed RNA polymerase subunit omega
MARITVEDCLKRIPNRFTLVGMVAKRVRQIREGSDLLVSSPKNEDIVIALREVAAGKITIAERSSLPPVVEKETEPSVPSPEPAQENDITVA